MKQNFTRQIMSKTQAVLYLRKQESIHVLFRGFTAIKDIKDIINGSVECLGFLNPSLHTLF